MEVTKKYGGMIMIKQLSIFLENKKGRMWKALDVLEEAGINIRALSLADTSDFGILRLVVPEPDRAQEVLEENGFLVKIGEVIAVGITDKPGGLNKILKILNKSGINLEYLYAFVEQNKNRAIVVLHPENIEAGLEALEKGNADVLSEEEVYSI
jgi:hypothetical protein